jgi:hypothetical protein
MPEIDKTINKETLYSSSQRYNILDRVADSTTSSFATLQLLDYCHTLHHSHTFSHTLSSFAYCLVFTALVLYIPKNGTIFQNCRLITIYHLDESSRELPGINSFFSGFLCSRCKHTFDFFDYMPLYMPPPIIPFFYTYLPIIFIIIFIT